MCPRPEAVTPSLRTRVHLNCNPEEKGQIDFFEEKVPENRSSGSLGASKHGDDLLFAVRLFLGGPGP